MKIRLLIIPILMLVMACGGMTTPPATTAGQMNQKDKIAKGYSEEEYLVAVGLGQSEPEAKNRAKAELSRIFESRIRSDTLDKMRAVLEASGTEQFEQSIESKVRVESDIELQGVEIAKIVKKGATYKALAVLDRAKARKEWRRRVLDLDAEADGNMKTYRGAATTLARYRALREVSDIWVKREVIGSRIIVLGFNPPPSPFDAGEVLRQIPVLRADMPILLDIRSDYSDVVRDSIGEALGRRGFVMTFEESEAAVIIDGTIYVEAVDISHPEWKYARATASLSVIDAENGQSVSDISEARRTAHVSQSEAFEQSVRKVAPKIVDAIIKAIDR